MSKRPTWRKNMTLEERFWAKVERRGEDECWPWQGSIGKGGYGRIMIDRVTWPAHRLSFFLENGPIPAAWGEVFICHTCDNPPCVNPNHLFVETHLGNMRDMAQKGRARKGRGTVREVAPGVFEVQVSAGWDAEAGKYRQRSRRVRGGPEEVERVRADLLAEVKRD